MVVSLLPTTVFGRPPRGRAETASMERKREDQSSLLPTKNFRPRISVNTRPSGIFLTEQLLNTYQLPHDYSPISVLSITHFLKNSTVRPNVQAVSAGVRRPPSTAAQASVLFMGHLTAHTVRKPRADRKREVAIFDKKPRNLFIWEVPYVLHRIRPGMEPAVFHALYDHNAGTAPRGDHPDRCCQAE